MAKDWGQKLTRVCVMSGWHMGRKLIDATFNEFTANGWDEERDRKTGFRCLLKFDADLNMVKCAAQANPSMIFFCLTVSHDSDHTEIHCGVGGRWLKATRKLSEAIGLRYGLFDGDYVHTMPRKPSLSRSGRSSQEVRRRKNRSGRQEKSGLASSATSKQPVACTAPKALKAKHSKADKSAEQATSIKVANRLVFHGLPAEVERCGALVLESLPAAEQAEAKYTTTGSEQYMSGALEFMTVGEPALRAFNKLVARVPGVTVTLEYADVRSGQRKLLRAVDGRIVEHRAV